MEDFQKNEIEKTGTLFLVSVPIGNPNDITLRAIDVLKTCDLVLCEEFKEGSNVLRKLNLTKDLDSINEHNEHEKVMEIINLLESGKNIALISDCGTPLLADPGNTLVRSCLSKKLNISVVPGASAILAALPRSGFDFASFTFAGFLSREPDKRKLQLDVLSQELRTIVLYETPYRILPFLQAAAESMPERKAYIGCNLTFHFESHHYGTFRELFDKFSNLRFKGEFVVVFEGRRYEDKAPGKRNYALSGRNNNPNERSNRSSSRYSDNREFSPRENNDYERRNQGERYRDIERRYDNDRQRDGDNRRSGSEWKKDGDNRRSGSEWKKDGDNRRSGSTWNKDGDNRRSGSEWKKDGDNRRSGSEWKKDGDNRRSGSTWNKEGDNRRSGSTWKKDGDNRRSGSEWKKDGDKSKSRNSNSGSNRRSR